MRPGDNNMVELDTLEPGGGQPGPVGEQPGGGGQAGGVAHRVQAQVNALNGLNFAGGIANFRRVNLIGGQASPYFSHVHNQLPAIDGAFRNAVIGDNNVNPLQSFGILDAGFRLQDKASDIAQRKSDIQEDLNNIVQEKKALNEMFDKLKTHGATKDVLNHVQNRVEHVHNKANRVFQQYVELEVEAGRYSELLVQFKDVIQTDINTVNTLVQNSNAISAAQQELDALKREKLRLSAETGLKTVRGKQEDVAALNLQLDELNQQIPNLEQLLAVRKREFEECKTNLALLEHLDATVTALLTNNKLYVNGNEAETNKLKLFKELKALKKSCIDNTKGICISESYYRDVEQNPIQLVPQNLDIDLQAALPEQDGYEKGVWQVMEATLEFRQRKLNQVSTDKAAELRNEDFSLENLFQHDDVYNLRSREIFDGLSVQFAKTMLMSRYRWEGPKKTVDKFDILREIKKVPGKFNWYRLFVFIPRTIGLLINVIVTSIGGAIDIILKGVALIMNFSGERLKQPLDHIMEQHTRGRMPHWQFGLLLLPALFAYATGIGFKLLGKVFSIAGDTAAKLTRFAGSFAIWISHPFAVYTLHDMWSSLMSCISSLVTIPLELCSSLFKEVSTFCQNSNAMPVRLFRATFALLESICIGVELLVSSLFSAMSVHISNIKEVLPSVPEFFATNVKNAFKARHLDQDHAPDIVLTSSGRKFSYAVYDLVHIVDSSISERAEKMAEAVKEAEQAEAQSRVSDNVQEEIAEMRKQTTERRAYTPGTEDIAGATRRRYRERNVGSDDETVRIN